MSKKILITPKSFGTCKEKAYPLLQEKGYEIIENTIGRTWYQGKERGGYQQYISC